MENARGHTEISIFYHHVPCLATILTIIWRRFHSDFLTDRDFQISIRYCVKCQMDLLIVDSLPGNLTAFFLDDTLKTE